MKNKIKQFIKQNDITEMENGSVEWIEMVIYVTGFEGDESDFFEAIENDEAPEFDALLAEEILDELGVEVF